MPVLSYLCPPNFRETAFQLLRDTPAGERHVQRAPPILPLERRRVGTGGRRLR
jgi:hypothetical protein